MGARDSEIDPLHLSEAEQKTLALNIMLESWERALRGGVAPEVLASVAIFAALTDMVDLAGEEAVADLCASLPERVRKGEFSFKPQS